MTRWHITNPQLDEREKDYTAEFTCTNGETGKAVRVTITQQKGDPAADLVGALRSVATLLVRTASNDDELEPAKIH
jgi:hypothetical protein